jgi:hypothetical protein
MGVSLIPTNHFIHFSSTLNLALVLIEELAGESPLWTGRRLASSLKVGLWLPLGFYFATKEIYRVITFLRRFRGTKVKFSLGKNDKYSDLVVDGEQ